MSHILNTVPTCPLHEIKGRFPFNWPKNDLAKNHSSLISKSETTLRIKTLTIKGDG